MSVGRLEFVTLGTFDCYFWQSPLACFPAAYESIGICTCYWKSIFISFSLSWLQTWWHLCQLPNGAIFFAVYFQFRVQRGSVWCLHSDALGTFEQSCIAGQMCWEQQWALWEGKVTLFVFSFSCHSFFCSSDVRWVAGRPFVNLVPPRDNWDIQCLHRKLTLNPSYVLIFP